MAAESANGRMHPTLSKIEMVDDPNPSRRMRLVSAGSVFLKSMGAVSLATAERVYNAEVANRGSYSDAVIVEPAVLGVHAKGGAKVLEVVADRADVWVKRGIVDDNGQVEWEAK